MKAKITLLYYLLTTLAFADNYPRNEAIDIKHYSFRLELNDTTNTIAGEAIVWLSVKKPFSSFELDLINHNGQHGMRVAQVLMNAAPVKFEHQNNRLKIQLPVQASINAVLPFTIRYSGIPADGLIISQNRYGDRTFFGDNWHDRARHWLPCIDHPYEKASVEFIVTAPQEYAVIANGIKREESYLDKNRKLTHWHEEADLSTKVMVIGVARFAVQHVAMVDQISVESWVYPQNRLEGFHDYAPAVPILNFFIGHIGPYSYRKLANVQSTTRYGGMENASNIFYYEKSITGKGGIDDLIAHEIAHQWFGNSASEKDWHHVWLSEGFATYLTHVYYESKHGKEKLAERLKNDRNEIISYCRKSPAPVINTAETDYSRLLTTHVYQRGAWVLHMMRQEVGDTAFWEGLRKYYRTYQNSNALSSDLQRIMEETSGKKLDSFFRQWLTRVEIPSLTMAWTYHAKSREVTLTIDQLQAGEPFDFPLQIGLTAESPENSQVETVRIYQKNQQVTISVPSKPQKVVLDPATNLLFEEISKK